MPIALSKLSPPQLLRLYGDVIDELRGRGVLRTSNNPVSDYGEYLVRKKLKLILAPTASASYDAIDPKSGLKYQIKSRRSTKYNKANVLGVIRNLEKADFDLLIAVVFNEDFSLEYAFILPRSAIKRNSRFSAHQNGHVVQLARALRDRQVKML